MRRLSYTELRPARICETIKLLARRIEERLHGSGLSRVANELVVIADEDQRALEHVRRPLWWVRGFTVFTFVVLAARGLWAGLRLLHVVGVQRCTPSLLWTESNEVWMAPSASDRVFIDDKRLADCGQTTHDGLLIFVHGLRPFQWYSKCGETLIPTSGAPEGLAIVILDSGENDSHVGQFWMNLDRYTSEVPNREKRSKTEGNGEKRTMPP